MRTVVSVEADRLAYTRGGGCLMVGSGIALLPFALLSLSVALGQKNPRDPMVLIMVFNGSLLAFGGLALAFGRRRTVVDKARNLVTQSWNLFIPLRTTWRPLSDYCRVAIDTRKAGRGHSITLFELSLEDQKGRSTVILYTPGEMMAEAYAKQLSEFLGFPV